MRNLKPIQSSPFPCLYNYRRRTLDGFTSFDPRGDVPWLDQLCSADLYWSIILLQGKPIAGSESTLTRRLAQRVQLTNHPLPLSDKRLVQILWQVPLLTLCGREHWTRTLLGSDDVVDFVHLLFVSDKAARMFESHFLAVINSILHCAWVRLNFEGWGGRWQFDHRSVRFYFISYLLVGKD